MSDLDALDRLAWRDPDEVVRRSAALPPDDVRRLVVRLADVEADDVFRHRLAVAVRCLAAGALGGLRQEVGEEAALAWWAFASTGAGALVHHLAGLLPTVAGWGVTVEGEPLPAWLLAWLRDVPAGPYRRLTGRELARDRLLGPALLGHDACFEDEAERQASLVERLEEMRRPFDQARQDREREGQRQLAALRRALEAALQGLAFLGPAARPADLFDVAFALLDRARQGTALLDGEEGNYLLSSAAFDAFVDHAARLAPGLFCDRLAAELARPGASQNLGVLVPVARAAAGDAACGLLVGAALALVRGEEKWRWLGWRVVEELGPAALRPDVRPRRPPAWSSSRRRKTTWPPSPLSKPSDALAPSRPSSTS
jgi:hypothetical protein